MTDKYIDVPGYGSVAFPDSMSDDDIAGAIKRLHPELDPQLKPAGTLAYKQETARRQFEANQPVPTAATGLQNLGAGIVNAAKNTAQGMGQLLGTHGPMGQLEAAKNLPNGMYHGMVDPVVNYIDALKRGDPDAAAYAGGQGLMQTAPAVIGAVKAIPITPESLMVKAAALRTAGTAPPQFPGAAAINAAIRVGARPAAGLMEALAKLPDSVKTALGINSPIASATADIQPQPPIERPVVRAPMNQAARRATVAVPETTAPESLNIPRPTSPLTDQFLAQLRGTPQGPQGFEQRVSGPAEPVTMANPPQSGPPVTNAAQAIAKIEKIIKPSPSKAASTVRIAPIVNEIAPQVAVEGRPGLVNAFRQMEAGVDAAEAAIPRTTTVPKQPIVDGLKTLQAEYEQRGLTAIASKIEGETAKWAELPDQITWDNFIARKRSFFDANNARSAPMRRAYGVLMDASSKYSNSPALQQANRSYSVLRQAMDNAGMDIKSGRDLRTVGKTPTTFPKR